MVSFYTDEIDENLPYLSALTNHHKAPYNKRKSGVIKGVSGELIELIEVN